MSSDIAIRVENLSKRYRIGTRANRAENLREAIIDVASVPFRRLRRNGEKTTAEKETAESIWALKNVSFDVNRGEVLGIIGRNGAGKSTLLKVLSRITDPTCGAIRIQGRLASLLEVGTGFHPELTGRENVYLNGSILGMRRREIDARFDEIVAFAEVARFIDTPVKRYSSGMYVRLAFAVAAHLRPEVLLVDEVLAVGDIGFQRKCLGKLHSVANEGRAVVFVSHQLSAIASLCETALLLDQGRVVVKGGVSDVIKAYQQKCIPDEDHTSHHVQRSSDIPFSHLHLSSVSLSNQDSQPTNMFSHDHSVIVDLQLSGEIDTDKFSISYHIHNELGTLVTIGSSGEYHNVYFDRHTKRVRARVGPLGLTGGKYSVSLYLWSEIPTRRLLDSWEHSFSFSVTCQPYRPGREILSAREGVCVISNSFAKIT